MADIVDIVDIVDIADIADIADIDRASVRASVRTSVREIRERLWACVRATADCRGIGVAEGL